MFNVQILFDTPAFLRRMWVTVCPTAGITVIDTVMADQNVCILCCACVKNCSTGARVWQDPWVKGAAEWLNINYRERKEPEVYV
jgi:ferredoxin